MSNLTGSDIVSRVKKQIKEIDVNQLQHDVNNGSEYLVVDIREQSEWVQGKIDTSHHISRGLLEFQIENLTTNRKQPIALLCAGGVRSALATRSLEEMGFENVVSVAGGFNAWKNAGYKF